MRLRHFLMRGTSRVVLSKLRTENKLSRMLGKKAPCLKNMKSLSSNKEPANAEIIVAKEANLKPMLSLAGKNPIKITEGQAKGMEAFIKGPNACEGTCLHFGSFRGLAAVGVIMHKGL